jgi:hypothetical protein
VRRCRRRGGGITDDTNKEEITMTNESQEKSAEFGKSIELSIFSRLIQAGLEVYVPLVDDHGVDAVAKRPDGTFVEIQIKARSKDIKFGNAALFADIKYPESRKNYWFVFYSERLDTALILSSKEFLTEASQNKTGKNAGTWSIHFNGHNTKQKTEAIKPDYTKYVAKNFNRIVNGKA